MAQNVESLEPTGGYSAVETAPLVAQAGGAASNLTGIYETGRGIYFVTEKDSKVYWLGVSKEFNPVASTPGGAVGVPVQAHVFVGSKSGNSISGKYGYLPMAEDRSRGDPGEGTIECTQSGTSFTCTSGTELAYFLEAYGKNVDFTFCTWTLKTGSDEYVNDWAFFNSCPDKWHKEAFTGIFDCDKGAHPGVSFFSQIHETVYFFGRSKDDQQYAHVGMGTVTDAHGTCELEWMDIPLGKNVFGGKLILKGDSALSPEAAIEVVSDDSNMFGCKTWVRKAGGMRSPNHECCALAEPVTGTAEECSRLNTKSAGQYAQYTPIFAACMLRQYHRGSEPLTSDERSKAEDAIKQLEDANDFTSLSISCEGSTPIGFAAHKCSYHEHNADKDGIRRSDAWNEIYDLLSAVHHRHKVPFNATSDGREQYDGGSFHGRRPEPSQA